MRCLFFMIFFAACVGCAQTELKHSMKPVQRSEQSGRLDKNKAIEIARLALSTDASFQRDKVSFDASRNRDKWWVTVWREPKRPGGFRLVEITDDGKVQRIYPGL